MDPIGEPTLGLFKTRPPENLIFKIKRWRTLPEGAVVISKGLFTIEAYMPPVYHLVNKNHRNDTSTRSCLKNRTRAGAPTVERHIKFGDDSETLEYRESYQFMANSSRFKPAQTPTCFEEDHSRQSGEKKSVAVSLTGPVNDETDHKLVVERTRAYAAERTRVREGYQVSSSARPLSAAEVYLFAQRYALSDAARCAREQENPAHHRLETDHPFAISEPFAQHADLRPEPSE